LRELTFSSVPTERYLCDVTVPRLKHPGEPFETLFTDCLHSFNLDVAKELVNLGFEVAAPEQTLNSVQIKVYSERQNNKTTLWYVSDGFRILSRSDPSEVVFSIVINDALGASQLEPLQLENYAMPIYTVCWLLLQGSKSGNLRIGSGLSCEVDLLASSQPQSTRASLVKTEFKNVLLVPFKKISSPILIEGFNKTIDYRCVIALSDNEAAFVSTGKTQHLLQLLARRATNQTNSPTRACISRKSYFHLA